MLEQAAGMGRCPHTGSQLKGTLSQKGSTGVWKEKVSATPRAVEPAGTLHAKAIPQHMVMLLWWGSWRINDLSYTYSSAQAVQ